MVPQNGFQDAAASICAKRRRQPMVWLHRGEFSRPKLKKLVANGLRQTWFFTQESPARLCAPSQIRRRDRKRATAAIIDLAQ
jgi:hypothetical protein